jgi:hypothetical protein
MATVIENDEKDVLVINGLKFEGFIDDAVCEKCSERRIYTTPTSVRSAMSGWRMRVKIPVVSSAHTDRSSHFPMAHSIRKLFT